MSSSRDGPTRRMMSVVERYGWAVQYVEGDRVRPPWAYTVGLVRHGLPEFVVTGLSVERTRDLLNDTAHGALCHGERWTSGQRFDLLSGTRIEVVELAHPEVHLRAVAALFPRLPLAAWQLVWCDGRGRWPWNPRFQGRRGGQPVLGPRGRRGT